jgi:hypothetical protein
LSAARGCGSPTSNGEYLAQFPKYPISIASSNGLGSHILIEKDEAATVAAEPRYASEPKKVSASLIND